ncbi:hypothetical protein BH23CHL5_BH23CHL5_23920 [soil metagenome]
MHGVDAGLVAGAAGFAPVDDFGINVLGVDIAVELRVPKLRDVLVVRSIAGDQYEVVFDRDAPRIWLKSFQKPLKDQRLQRVNLWTFKGKSRAKNGVHV